MLLTAEPSLQPLQYWISNFFSFLVSLGHHSELWSDEVRWCSVATTHSFQIRLVGLGTKFWPWVWQTRFSGMSSCHIFTDPRTCIAHTRAQAGSICSAGLKCYHVASQTASPGWLCFPVGERLEALHLVEVQKSYRQDHQDGSVIT